MPPKIVAIVLDPAYASQLATLAERAAVWIVDSAENRPVMESLWTARRSRGAAYDVTVFRTIPGLTPAEHLEGVLRSMARHADTAEPSAVVGAIEVYGAEANDSLRTTFATHGYERVEALADGFRAQRGSAR